MPAAYAAGVQPKPCTTVNKWQERNEEGNEEWAKSMRVGAYIFKSMRVGAYIFKSMRVGAYIFKSMRVGAYIFKSMRVGAYTFTGLALTIDLACYHCSCRLHLT
jgi:hypothetical protein